MIVRVGGKNLRCSFYLVFANTDVDLRASSVSCNRGAGGKTGTVNIRTEEGFVFEGVIKPPRKIMSMTGGDIYGSFFSNVSMDSNPIKTTACGGYGTNIVGKSFPRGYTTSGTELWPNGVVEYSFVSDGSDSMKDFAFYVDPKVGYKQSEIEIIIKAMKRIEDVTCIRFHRITPEPGKKWLLLMREGSATDCFIDYINDNLKNKVVGNLGKVFNRWWSGLCLMAWSWISNIYGSQWDGYYQ